MRRIASAVCLSFGLCLLVPLSHADAAERCVTREEYRKVKDGMPKARVHRIFDSAGKESWSIGRYQVRKYVPCTDRQFGYVTVNYKDDRVDAKRASW